MMPKSSDGRQTDSLSRTVRSSKYDVARLAPIVATSRSLAEVLRRLGLPATGGNYRMLGARIRQAWLDTAHLRTHTIAARCAAVTLAELAPRVAGSTSVAQVLDQLNLPTEGRSHRELTRRIRELGLDTSHFRGPGWSRGETRKSHPSVARSTTRRTWSDAEVFVENSPLLDGRSLTRRLVAMGWAYCCACCGLVEWSGKPLVLHVDHVNGITNDNRIGNLRFLCPNCHSQTETYGNRRR